MLCTFSEAAKFLGYSSRSQLYKLRDLGVLDEYLEVGEGKTYLNMKPTGKLSLAQHIMHNTQWRGLQTIIDFDPDVYLKEEAERLAKALYGYLMTSNSVRTRVEFVRHGNESDMAEMNARVIEAYNSKISSNKKRIEELKKENTVIRTKLKSISMVTSQQKSVIGNKKK